MLLLYSFICGLKHVPSGHLKVFSGDKDLYSYDHTQLHVASTTVYGLLPSVLI